MTEYPRIGNYVVVSPVKDEGPYVERTIRSMVGQSLRPRRWIIVDDGSLDGTPQILAQYSRKHPWITVVRLVRNGERKPGSAVISAFIAGYKQVEDDGFDFVVKLDCDLEIPSEYFESLVNRFETDHRLGIASGIYSERRGGFWEPVKMPEYHAAGCSKMVRMECFRQMGGFVPQRGWDTVDEIRAQIMGWTTRHFEDLVLRHLKTEGVGIGSSRTNMMHGQIYYLTGGGMPFFFLKVLHRAFAGKPVFIGGLMMLVGYIRARFMGEPRLVSDSETECYRHLLNARILAPWTELLGRYKPSRKKMGWS